nr:Serine/threonine-protein kinase [Polyrhizophydium stewartii]
MGNLVSSATPRATLAGIDSYVGELPEITYEKSLGSSRFLKTIRCRHPQGLVVVKIFVKTDPTLSLKSVVKQLQNERDLIQGLPNVLANQQIIESDRAGYMIRQFIASNLYDRISNRPFLTNFEKKWVAFQLLTGVVEAHSRQVFHGDIKTENVFCTSWNWVYLADFSSFKPTYLPEDNPADFTFFFDTSARRICYLAPERFYESGESLSSERISKLTPEMDVFSLGCTIAEVFLEGTPVFTLAQLLQFRKGAYDPSVLLERIEDQDIRALVKHMIQLDPSMRLSAHEYLNKWRGTAFPEYFFSFLHPYVASLSDPYFASNMAQYHVFLANSANAVIADMDAKIDRIYFDFDKIAEALEIPNTSPPTTLSIPNFTSNITEIPKSVRAADAGLVFIAAVSAAIRNTLYPTSRLRGLDLLLALAIHVPDEQKLDRIVPYMVALLSDENPNVRVNALAALTQLLLMVKSITPSDAGIFPEYILPSLRRFTSDANVLARAAYAQCIPAIGKSSEVALQFLELSQMLKSESNLELDMDMNVYQMSYDANLRDLQDIIQEDVEALLIDSHPLVKRSLLTDMPRLCIFFGRQKANDVLLSHMITYLNDPDWSLRSAFCETIVGVGTFVGMRSLDEYILPLMVQALTDSEEYVVEKVLNSLTSLAELGLIAKTRLKELCSTVPRLLYEQTVQFAGRSNNDGRAGLMSIDAGLAEAPGQTGGERNDLLVRLRDLGMADEDKEKLFAMKYFISKASAARLRVRRPSKTGSVGNYDLTADPAFVHAADGQEKYIRRVLEKKTKELFPPALPELGHKVTLASRAAAVDARLRRTRTGIAAQSELKGWKPKGILVAHFPEHVSQINCIAVAPDHSFFATCSDDGTVKIWDTNRLHTNVANRARITYAGLGGKVKALAFCESRHSIVSAADNGQIHINRVEYIKPQTGSLKYTGTPLVRAVTLRNEFAVLLDHSESETQSLLVYATTRGRLCGLDLRSMREVWGFQVPAHYGAVTALVTDPKRTWVMVGTHRGVLLLWDVRFQLCTKVWAHPSRARINKLAMYTYRSQTRAGVNAGGRLVAMAALEPPGAQDLIDATASLSLHSIPRHLGARSFTIHPEVPFMAAVGNDRKLRFWDLDKAEDSFVVSGLEDDAAMPNSQLYGDINFNVEYPAPQHFVPPAVGSSPAVSFYESARPPPANTSWSPLRNLPGMQSPDEQSARSKGTGSTASSSASQSGAGGSGGVAGSLGGGGGNRSSWPSDRQMASKGAELVTSAVPRRHLDGITDVAVTQFPHPMIITGSRDGIVKVWQ